MIIDKHYAMIAEKLDTKIKKYFDKIHEHPLFKDMNVRDMFVGNVIKPLTQMSEELKKEKRTPNILLIGASGAGKTTLMIALSQLTYAQAKIENVSVNSGVPETGTSKIIRTEIANYIDTRGYLEGRPPAQDDIASTSEESVKNAINDLPPDVIVHVITASSLTNDLSRDLECLSKVNSFVYEKYCVNVPIITVITRVFDKSPERINFNDADLMKEIYSERCHLEFLETKNYN
eukprot:TRINITY_DN1081_c0_g1_i1.p2 TRINITY_DN1081_c0_g1~~TRINITY_DN1081_c0_g1_i1.p2  ORF type:complete len:233 (-),score=19.37 TRINITY_DN1081_c0_g1_i1:1530-2228(-)